jgi:uncharacterized RDD family membrane protein YckC
VPVTESSISAASAASPGVRIGPRRLAAFAVDYVLILAWIGLISAVGLGARSLLGMRLGTITSDRDKLIGHAISFLVLTLPVVLFFAIAEHCPWRGTPGKRLLGLEVVSIDGGGTVPWSRCVVRAAVKFAPWEVAHTVIWHSPGQPFVSGPNIWGLGGYVVALSSAAFYVASLFKGTGRTPYDRAARTVTVRRKRSDSKRPPPTDLHLPAPGEVVAPRSGSRPTPRARYESRGRSSPT